MTWYQYHYVMGVIVYVYQTQHVESNGLVQEMNDSNECIFLHDM
jgi:hypothetical protein